MTAMQLAGLFCLLATAIATTLQVNFPLNLQLPPIARVGEAYSFQFAATTFQPNPDQLVYSIANGPSWLYIHSENRTLWGTPEVNDAGTARFIIAAVGEASAVANMELQLPVKRGEGPRVNGNISQVLSKAGQLSGPRTVTLLPSKSFEIIFGQDHFQRNDKKLTYHTTLADHTPLPAWISFDAQSLRYSGTTPSSASPQTFEILLIASDTPDYASASMSFSLVVSNHLLLFKPLMQTVNVSKGERVDIKGLKGMVFLDNAPIRNEDIQSASADLPQWLSFDTHSFDITGSPPSGLMSQNISVTVQDKFGNRAEHSIHLTFMSHLFTGEVGRLNITPGVRFEHRISKSILTLDGETVSLEFGNLNKWLNFDPQSLTISGIVPNDTATCSVEGFLTATSPDGTTKDTQTFQIEVLGAATNDPSNLLDSGTDPGKHNGNATADTASSSRKKAGVIVGTVLASLFGAAVIIILALSLCRRRKKHKKGYISPSAPRSPRKTDISRPIPRPSTSIVMGWGEVDRAEDGDLEKGKLDDSPHRIAKLAHQLHPPPPTEKKIGHSCESSVNESESNNFISFQRDSLSFQAEARLSHHPHDSMTIATDMLRRKSAGSPSQHRRYTNGVSRNSIHRSSGLSVNRRLRGLGRGQHTHSRSRSTNFSAAQRTLSSSSRTTALSTVPSTSPQTSKARHTTQLTTSLEKRQSIRPVVPSVCESPVDRLFDPRPFDEKRHSYIRKRASAQQSPLLAGSRVSSSSFMSPPSFLGDSSPAPKPPLATLSPNIVRSDDTFLSSDDISENLRIRRPADTPSPATSNFDMSRSLRKNRSREVLRRHMEPLSTESNEPNEISSARPGTALYAPTEMDSCTSTYGNLCSADLMTDLNKVAGTEIWDDAERSENNYSGDEYDMEEGQRRATLRPSRSVQNYIGLLKLDEKKKRDSKRNSTALKKTSERDPTSFYHPNPVEHGGKENLDSSLYSLTGDTTPRTTHSCNPHIRLFPLPPKTIRRPWDWD